MYSDYLARAEHDGIVKSVITWIVNYLLPFIKSAILADRFWPAQCHQIPLGGSQYRNQVAPKPYVVTRLQ